MRLKCFILSIVAALCFSTALWAAPANTQYIDDDISVTFRGVERDAQGNFMLALYSVLASRDSVITVDPEASFLFDPNGLQFRTGYTSIIGHSITDRREIAANVPTSVLIRYYPEVDYAITPFYSRVNLVINGKNVLFRDVPSNPLTFSPEPRF